MSGFKKVDKEIYVFTQLLCNSRMWLKVSKMHVSSAFPVLGRLRHQANTSVLQSRYCLENSPTRTRRFSLITPTWRERLANSQKTKHYYHYFYYFTHLRIFYTSVMKWFSTRVWVTASILKSLSNLSDQNNEAVRMVSTSPLISQSTRPCTDPLANVPSAPITIGIIVTFIPLFAFF